MPIAILALLASGSLAAATIYKWVDANGVTHYSDQPRPGAQKIEVESAQTYSAPRTPTPASAPAPTAAPEPAGYELCEIYRPVNDEVYFNVQTVDVRLRLQPDLRSGDRALLMLDGKPMQEIAYSGGGFTMSPVYRGTHRVHVIVEGPDGAPLCTTQVIAFHVRQPSVQAPNPANRPRF
jgi:hypothetical protein